MPRGVAGRNKVERFDESKKKTIHKKEQAPLKSFLEP